MQESLRNKRKTFSSVYITTVLVVARLEAGSSTSTVTLRVVGGDENGSLIYETVIYGLDYQRSGTRERLR
jgi:hypothetical protein